MINIALDGPAGSGKSTVAKTISKKLDILYLDTGAMYRACGLKCLNEGVDVKDAENVEKVIKDIDLKIYYKDGAQVTCLDGKDVSTDIRKPEVSMLASTVSAHRSVRLKMVEMQREIASSTDCVLDGRDIGSYVLPNAKYKFYVTADSKVRAERRYKELIERGEKVDFDALHQEIIQRDYNDSHRDFAPLVQAEDAILVDTSYMTVEEVVDKIISYIKEA
ncbi:MAG: (d)CMP kinase [Clostridia bacterium]|nr:(d)CMP kinase [Clostridia bacterium]